MPPGVPQNVAMFPVLLEAGQHPPDVLLPYLWQAQNILHAAGDHPCSCLLPQAPHPRCRSLSVLVAPALHRVAFSYPGRFSLSSLFCVDPFVFLCSLTAAPNLAPSAVVINMLFAFVSGH